MNFTFSDEQRLFQRTVREFLDKECPPEHVRAMATHETGRSPELWKGLAELGILGLTVPESYGGLGKGETDLVLILEEAGRAALPEPIVETVAVMVPLLRDHAPEIAAEWLPRVAAGDAILTYGESPRAIADLHVADLVAFPFGGTTLVLPGTGLARRPLTSVDPTRRIYTIGTPAETSLGLPGGDVAASAAFDRGALATSAVLCGITDRVIEMAASYARERHQFGKPIGSFQAVKHLLADALLGLDFARPVVYRAAWSVARSSPERARDVSMAKAYASDAAINACRAALQVHGAIGYTHEHDLHLWLNKGFALAHAWGTAAWHRERVAGAVLG